ncbi:AraC family transcriptional regulator [Gracilibacillus caseinilyticus]|uniref:AraC family transcriptional regulator n=1 Tax=Gracilibacillus caseinilyticus TaxID=2932256 RepID=A0ABY4EQ33_9BACI|nr:AraC family transcriptional regulator [Gracilibacillus caseinilyticus]UOQ46568.1 AraC family transcriptional regulator [Gracilibacillus caseinilyticus]
MCEKISSHYRYVDEVHSTQFLDYHSHERYEIYLFHSGSCQFIIGDHIYDLQENDMIIMNGLTLHRPYPKKGTLYERSVIEFSSEWLKPILNRLNVAELLDPFNLLSNTLFRGVDQEGLAEIKELMRKIDVVDIKLTESSKKSVENRLEGEVTTLLIQLLFKIYEITKMKQVDIPLVKSEKDIHVNRIISWIDNHFDNNLNLDSIANELNISKYYMSRIFKDITGYTIMQYMMSCRINRAKYLLEVYPDKTILEVALESGFENSSHFSRFFRKQVSVTPTEYRNSRVLTHTQHRGDCQSSIQLN